MGARSIDLVRRHFRRGVLDGEVIFLFVLEGDDLITARGSLVDRSQRLEEDLVGVLWRLLHFVHFILDEDEASLLLDQHVPLQNIGQCE